jgi:hypothetical protein
MASHVDLVGSRVRMTHVAHDCPRSAKTVTLTITDGGEDSTGHRRLTQEPRDCHDCGVEMGASLLIEASERDRPALRSAARLAAIFQPRSDLTS